MDWSWPGGDWGLGLHGANPRVRVLLGLEVAVRNSRRRESRHDTLGTEMVEVLLRLRPRICCPLRWCGVGAAAAVRLSCSCCLG